MQWLLVQATPMQWQQWQQWLLHSNILNIKSITSTIISSILGIWNNQPPSFNFINVFNILKGTNLTLFNKVELKFIESNKLELNKNLLLNIEVKTSYTIFSFLTRTSI